MVRALLNRASQISDISGELISTFNHHRTDPRLFSPFAILQSRGTLSYYPIFSIGSFNSDTAYPAVPPCSSSCLLGTIPSDSESAVRPATNTPDMNFIPDRPLFGRPRLDVMHPVHSHSSPHFYKILQSRFLVTAAISI